MMRSNLTSTTISIVACLVTVSLMAPRSALGADTLSGNAIPDPGSHCLCGQNPDKVICFQDKSCSAAQACLTNSDCPSGEGCVRDNCCAGAVGIGGCALLGSTNNHCPPDKCDNPGVCGTYESCEAALKPIPTVSQWGIAIMALLLLVGAKVYFSRRRAMQA